MSKLSDISSPPILIPIVLPHSGDTSSGRVRNLPVSPQAVPRMLERRSGGAYGIKGSYAEKGYGAHGPGFGIVMVSNVTMQGLCLLAALRLWGSI